MRLKEIKLAGFKSFVDPTAVVLPGNRNAVVGPNGCGKSNIIDAVRWVMGESSARQLRGQALTDVIFNGSNARQATALASVELLFDNRDGRVGGKFASYAEIAIRREVSRDAQSTYYLNGTRCRRRDIADVFLGTGFGPRSYSIIEQGMISELVEAKPDDLRAYLEEAAGISKYRERRRETHNRIRHTVENLERLADIRDELGRQLAHLKRQAKAAERYRELKEQERRRSAELFAIRIDDLSAQLQQSEAAANALETDLVQAQSSRQTLDTALEKSRAVHAERSDAADAAQGSYYQLSANAGRLEQAIAFDRDRIAQLEADLEALAVRQQEAAGQLKSDLARIDATEQQLAAARPTLARRQEADRVAAEKLVELERHSRSLQRDWEAFNRRANDNASEQRVCRGRIEHAQQTTQNLRDRHAKLDQEHEAPRDAGLGALTAQVEAAQREVSRLDAALAANEEALTTFRQEVAVCEADERAANAAAETERRDLAAVAAVQEAALGRKQSPASAAERWIDDRGLREATRLGQQLTVEPGWERAVEMVLGADLQAIVTEDAAALAAQLVEIDSGRVTLIDAQRTGAGVASGLPLLAAFVRQELGALAAGVFAADSIDAALAHRSHLAPGESVVTREGLWLGADWLRWDRGTQESEGVIQRTRELAARRGAVAAAEATAQQCAERLGAARQRLRALEQEREAERREHTAAAAQWSRLAAEHKVRRVRLEEAIARAQRIVAEKKELRTQIEAETQRLADCGTRLEDLAAAAEQLRAEGDTLHVARERDAEQLGAARAAARQAQDAFHRQRAEARALEASLAAARTASERLLAQRQQSNARDAELRAAVVSTQQAIPGKQKALEEQLANRLAVERELAELRREMGNIETEIRTLTGRRAEAERKVEATRARLQEVRLGHERLAANRDNLLAQLKTTRISLEEARRGLPDDAAAAQWEEALAAIARRIARLGAINLAAIDEYQTQSERKQYLDAQHEDLETALATLQDAIRRIDRDTRERFKDTFNRVNGHLKTLFPKFFGGGHAVLQVTGEDWLDTGITLMAQPPGKRNASIHLLSGGEKAMTAVALIFSIFQLNPSPVCLLDEVDAPLDDTNVARFAELIREMSSDVQFVVVTHNKQTIEMADYLLGVTMQEAGVSRLVSVDVDKAARMAAAG